MRGSESGELKTLHARAHFSNYLKMGMLEVGSRGQRLRQAWLLVTHTAAEGRGRGLSTGCSEQCFSDRPPLVPGEQDLLCTLGCSSSDQCLQCSTVVLTTTNAPYNISHHCWAVSAYKLKGPLPDLLLHFHAGGG